MANKNKAISDKAIRVRSFLLTITRSKICNMYIEGVSASRLATMLKNPTTRNSRLKGASDAANSLRRKKENIFIMAWQPAASIGRRLRRKLFLQRCQYFVARAIGFGGSINH